MIKNLLADTNYTKGYDNRFKNAVVIGKVSKIECSNKGANVRVLLNDKVDHTGQPLITKPIPVWQTSAGKKKTFAMPRIGQNAVLVKLPNSMGDYLLLGTFYTKNDPPPVTDPLIDYKEWEGGHIEKYDANEGADVFLTQDFKGGWDATIKKDVNLKTTDSAKFNIEADGDVLVKSATGNVNVESPTGTVTIKQQTIELQATTIKLTGHVIVTGNIDETGVHHDNLGYHTTGREADLAQRVANLEKRLSRLEQSSGGQLS